MVKNPPALEGTQVQSLVREDSTCCRAAKSMHHNYGSLHTLEPMLCNRRSHNSEKPMHHKWGVAPACCNQRKPTHSNKDPVQPK